MSDADRCEIQGRGGVNVRVFDGIEHIVGGDSAESMFEDGKGIAEIAGQLCEGFRRAGPLRSQLVGSSMASSSMAKPRKKPRVERQTAGEAHGEDRRTESLPWVRGRERRSLARRND